MQPRTIKARARLCSRSNVILTVGRVCQRKRKSSSATSVSHGRRASSSRSGRAETVREIRPRTTDILWMTGSRRRERRHRPAQDVEWKLCRRSGESKSEREPIESRSRRAEWLPERLWTSWVAAAVSVGTREIGKREKR